MFLLLLSNTGISALIYLIQTQTGVELRLSGTSKTSSLSSFRSPSFLIYRMPAFLTAASVVVCISSVLAEDCLWSKDQKTCFVDGWPSDTICPNHAFAGQPYEYLSGYDIKVILADINHKPKCKVLKDNSRKARCEHVIQYDYLLPGQDKGYTFLWTYLTLLMDGSSNYEFGGLYWHRVSNLKEIFTKK